MPKALSVEEQDGAIEKPCRGNGRYSSATLGEDCGEQNPCQRNSTCRCRKGRETQYGLGGELRKARRIIRSCGERKIFVLAELELCR